MALGRERTAEGGTTDGEQTADKEAAERPGGSPPKSGRRRGDWSGGQEEEEEEEEEEGKCEGRETMKKKRRFLWEPRYGLDDEECYIKQVGARLASWHSLFAMG